MLVAQGAGSTGSPQPPGDPRCPRSGQELPWRCWQRVREGWGCARQHPSPQLLAGNGQQADWGRHRVAALTQRITVKLQERGGQELGWGQGALLPVQLQSRAPAFGTHQAVSPPPRTGERRGAQPSPAFICMKTQQTSLQTNAQLPRSPLSVQTAHRRGAHGIGGCPWGGHGRGAGAGPPVSPGITHAVQKPCTGRRKARRIPLALFAGCWPRAIAPRWLGGGWPWW